MWMDSLVFSFLILCISVDYAQPKRVREQFPFDLLIFTQQWPLTVCKDWKEHDESRTCTLPSNVDLWTIHGVWPTKLGSMGPAYCNRTWHFDPEQIKPIEKTLTQYWTNIEAEPLTYNLWSHEWNKHGTCATVLEPLNSEFKYFSQGLKWLQSYSMSNILSPTIVPSNNKMYGLDDIHNVVKAKLNVNAAIECRKIEGKSWLIEIRICFNKTLHLNDCDGILGFRAGDVKNMYKNTMTKVLTNCDLKEKVYFPRDVDFKGPPNKLIVQLYKLTSWLQWFTL